MGTPEAMAPVTIAAGLPLLRVGLERIAAAAGLPVAGPDTASALALRSQDHEPTSAPFEVAAEADRVVVTIRAAPDDVTWAAVTRLVNVLVAESVPANADGSP
jgi:hypothetical protein